MHLKLDSTKAPECPLMIALSVLHLLNRKCERRRRRVQFGVIFAHLQTI